MAERRDEGGFTLIEVLVALAVVGMILATVYRLFGTGVLNVGRGNEQLTLALAADALLERTRADLDPRGRDLTGVLPDGNAWQMTALPMELPPPAGERVQQRMAAGESAGQEDTAAGERRGANLLSQRAASQSEQRLWVVHVQVENRNGRTFTLSTLRWLPEPTS
jgi:prepilin-type N-terminal cleavage/methylation domain-containing protein